MLFKFPDPPLSEFILLGITDLTTFIIGTTLIVLLPGPNSLYVMSIASRYGIKTGYFDVVLGF